jgi:hypothetical protein
MDRNNDRNEKGKLKRVKQHEPDPFRRFP